MIMIQLPYKQDLTGKRFGNWTVIKYADRNKFNQNQWLCKCICGKERPVTAGSLNSGTSKGCGCVKVIRNLTTHGESRQRRPSPELIAFDHAKGRCQNPNNAAYDRYGGRGIEFRFESFEDFLADVGRRPYYSLDRINNEGHYEKGNVRWATAEEQGNNKRNNVVITAVGESKSVAAWAESSGIPKATIVARLYLYGWCHECSVTIIKGHCTHRDKWYGKTGKPPIK